MTIHSIDCSGMFGSNIFLIVGTRTVLVDAGSGVLPKRMISEIKGILKDRRLDMIVLTHCHFDHIGGAKALTDEFGSDIMAGIGDAPYIANGDPEYTAARMFGSRLSQLDVMELVEGDIIDLGDHRLRVVNTPGHTMGGICLYDEITRSLFSGDTVFSGGVGRTDLISGSTRDLINSLRKLKDLDISTLYPGHGDCASDGNRAVKYGLIMMGG
jgi:Zn-dependent hydrolases, including glyoxylases